jgi:hypothetical protein
MLTPLLVEELHQADVIIYKAQNNRDYADDLYCALCNNIWTKNVFECHLSWREAAREVANLRGKGEYYLEFYPHMSPRTVEVNGVTVPLSEGYISTEISEDMLHIGWSVK